MESLREKVRRQLADRYRQDVEKGTLLINDAKQMIVHLQNALETAKKTNRRIVVEGQEQLGSLSSMEIEDQMIQRLNDGWQVVQALNHDKYLLEKA